MVEEVILNTTRQIIFAPLKTPELIPTLLPLILGGVVLELYFGKHKNESLGWNSSVANSAIWVSTGLTLLLTANISTPLERHVSYFLVSIGAFTGYMNFFHKWSPSIAFMASSSGAVYSLAYVAVVMIKSEMPVNTITLKAAALSLIVITAAFQFIKLLEAPAGDELGLDM